MTVDRATYSNLICLSSSAWIPFATVSHPANREACSGSSVLKKPIRVVVIWRLSLHYDESEHVAVPAAKPLGFTTMHISYCQY